MKIVKLEGHKMINTNSMSAKQIKHARANAIGSKLGTITIMGYNDQKLSYLLECDCGRTSQIQCSRYENTPVMACKKCNTTRQGSSFVTSVQEVDSRDNTEKEQNMISSWLKTHNITDVRTKG